MREKITSLTPNGLSLLTQMVSLHHGEKEGKVEGSSDDAASLHLLLHKEGEKNEELTDRDRAAARCRRTLMWSWSGPGVIV